MVEVRGEVLKVVSREDAGIPELRVAPSKIR